MSIDAIALLPAVSALRGADLDGTWRTGRGPGGATGAWRALADGVLLNLGFPIDTPGGDLHDIARRWLGDTPKRIWVFPDTAVPGDQTAGAIQAATARVGRWVSPRPRRRTLLTEMGFTPEEEDAFQRDVSSGDPARAAAARAALENRLSGRDPESLDKLLDPFREAR